MIRAARRGARVVRLKGGDPFVFGRGGEEALALRAAGVPCEIVPGISSAIAAPALAGIPVTHRGLARGFVVIAGHDRAVYRPILDTLIPEAVTLVVLMGLAERRAIARALLANAWPRSTPAAIVGGASTASQTVWTGTLGALSRGALPDGLPSQAATIVIGTVVTLRARIQHGVTDRARKAVR
jgi:uroporphyrin-III C-methyltransferase/precorrin-2 dehydrogenase/sirohydrochlorin ferrochelatase